MFKVLWERIPNVRSKARESTEAMSLAFVLLDFQHAGVRRSWELTVQIAVTEFLLHLAVPSFINPCTFGTGSWYFGNRYSEHG